MGKEREGRERKRKGEKKGKQRVQKGREVEEEGDVIYMSMKKKWGRGTWENKLWLFAH